MRLLLALLMTVGVLVAGVSAASCAGGNELECASSLCGNYTYANNTCTLVPGRNCGVGAIWQNNQCLTCLFQSQSTCTSTCPDHIWTPIGSAPSSCYACYQVYGAECIKCTTSICTACSYTSGTTLSSDSKSCILSTCSVSNCV